uniref:Uncharacterized protein n=1 Tax=Hyaloperonospora arabidopsidis (strain Emoy2) TaxID=559515 RepID=M4BEY9_HYAAE
MYVCVHDEARSDVLGIECLAVSLYCFFFAPAMVFFMATWEEYYTGTLVLPVINGPNEGFWLCT